MAFGNTPKDAMLIPLSAVYVPNTGLIALQGVNASSDGNSNTSALAALAVYGKATNPGDTALLLDSLGRMLIGNIVQIGGQAPQLDNTNKLGISLYGKATNPGDTPVLLDASGRPIVNINTMPAITGVVTANLDATNSTHLANLDTHIPALGAQTIANSSAVNIASDQVVPTKGSFTEQTGLSAGSLNADLVAATDVSGYKSVSLQIDGTAYVGTLTFQWSNDNVNFYPLIMNRMDTPGSSATSTTTLNATGYCVNVFFHYFRVRMTTWTSGAAHGTLDLFTSPMTFQPGVAQQGTWTMMPGNTANTTPWLVTHANNNASVPTGAANTVIKASAGPIASLVVTTAGTGAGNVIIFDNASTNSGTPLFAFPATVSAGQSYQIYGYAKVGMTAQNVLNGPVFTVYYA